MAVGRAVGRTRLLRVDRREELRPVESLGVATVAKGAASTRYGAAAFPGLALRVLASGTPTASDFEPVELVHRHVGVVDEPVARRRVRPNVEVGEVAVEDRAYPELLVFDYPFVGVYRDVDEPL